MSQAYNLTFKACVFAAASIAALSFAQEPSAIAIPAEAAPAPAPQPDEAIKFQIPTDESGAPAPAAPPPPRPEAAQRAGLAQNMPLNLALLSAKDTAGFETYSKRHALIQDSISAVYRQMEHVKNNTRSYMQPLAAKGEFEKQADYESRQSKWNAELAQRIDKDSKSLSIRLAELNKAKAKVLENQSALYGSVEIKSIPSAVSIWIGKDEIGATPAEYKLLIPGAARISLRKEGYSQFDTLLQVAPGAKLKLNAELYEKSIFSAENEIDFPKLLAKDTSEQGYLARIEKANARKAEAAEELKPILESFANSYPALEPQRPGESPESFANRQKAWTNEGMRRYAELQRKAQGYEAKLDRSIAVLNDYIVALHSSVITEAAMFAKIELGAYDSEKETFELVAHDSASQKSPFYFSGKVGVPISSASALNRAAPGFASAVQFINFPFEADSAKVNLAMHKLQLSLGGKELRTEGSFKEIERYKSLEGYGAWKAHADSILSGALKAQGLDYNYAMGKAAAKDAAAKKSAGKGESPGGLGWRGWTRIAAYSLAAGGIALAALKHIDARDYKKRVDEFDEEFIALAGNKYPAGEVKKRNSNANKARDSESQRNIYGICAGSFALAGTLTFFF